ncbi:MAG: rhomboid family intramembrane serine protease [Terrimonas sp.]|nr:rhomboid family intramembrane serine protease [Terrimonas sp.]
MPSAFDTIAVSETDLETLMRLCFGVCKTLNWQPRYAGENKIIAYTKKSALKREDEIFIETAPGSIMVKSSLTHGAIVDLLGRNKKNINNFFSAYASLQDSSEQQRAEWQQGLEEIRKSTVLSAASEAAEAAEIEKAMRLSSGNTYATTGIIAINFIVFIMMVVSGVSFISPTAEQLLQWGGNFRPNTVGGEWWRLISCVFVHIGIIHLLFNMYALYYVGIFLEPMLGKARYISAYLCTGVLASLLSLWWHKQPLVSAGASGAIFGMYGVFVALLTTNLIPKKVRNNLLQSIGIFVGYNLLYGMKSGVDNAAHMGGLVSGIVFGYVFFLSLRPEAKISRQWVTGIISAVTIAVTFFYLNNNKDDSKKFNEIISEFSLYESKALQPLRDAQNLSADRFKEQLKAISLPAWENCSEALEKSASMKLPATMANYRKQLQEYILLRKEQAQILIKAQDADEGVYDEALDQNMKKIEDILKNLQGE